MKVCGTRNAIVTRTIFEKNKEFTLDEFVK
jgi:hypothetical protein